MATFFDKTQRLNLPADSLTWDDLGNAPYQTWDNWTGWYQNLNDSSTTFSVQTPILDAQAQITGVPVIRLRVVRDGDVRTTGTFITGKPSYLIEAGNASDLSDAVSTTISKDTSPNYVTLGSKRYYRVTATINTGSNAAPNGVAEFVVTPYTEFTTENVNIDTSTVDDGSSVTRTISLLRKYSDVIICNFTPVDTITDDQGYIANPNPVMPIYKLESSTRDSITISVKTPSGVETDGTVDIEIKGLPEASVRDDGNVTIQ